MTSFGKTYGSLFSFFSANLISYTGNRLTLLAIPWFVLETTGSVAKTGITAFFTALPSIISSFLSGPIVDRLGYKRSSVISDLVSGISVALIPLFSHTIGLAFWQLLVLTFLGGLLKAPGETARSSLLPDLGRDAKIRMERVNAVGDGLIRISGFLGSPLAAVLILLIGSTNLLWLDAASFFISALLIGCIGSSPSVMLTKKDGKGEEISSNLLLDGLRFVLYNRLLLSIVIIGLITNLLDSALFSVVLPDYSKQIWGSVLPIGFLSAAFGACAFLSTIFYGTFGHYLPRRMTYIFCFIAIGMRFWALAFRFPLLLLITIYALTGLVVGPINPIATTVQQEQIPGGMRARVFGVISAGYLAGVPIGGLVGGYLIAWIGLIPALFVIGTCYLIATSSLLVNPALKAMQGQSGMEPI